MFNVETLFSSKLVKFGNVFYVSEFHFNLISTSKLKKQENWIHAERKCLVNSEDTL